MYREIRPRPSSSSSPPQGGPSSDDSTKPTRMACDPCRRSKTRCGGQRPVCQRCIRRKVPCTYQGDPDETPAEILRRKHTECELRLKRLEDLFKQLATRPDRDAYTIYQRIRSLRSMGDIDTFIDFIQQGDLLTQMLVHPMPSESLPNAHQSDTTSSNTYSHGSSSSNNNDDNRNDESNNQGSSVSSKKQNWGTASVTTGIAHQIITSLTGLPDEDRNSTIEHLHTLLDCLGPPHPIEPPV